MRSANEMLLFFYDFDEFVFLFITLNIVMSFMQREFNDESKVPLKSTVLFTFSFNYTCKH